LILARIPSGANIHHYSGLVNEGRIAVNMVKTTETPAAAPKIAAIAARNRATACRGKRSSAQADSRSTRRNGLANHVV
jgi:hypothetical protein